LHETTAAPFTIPADARKRDQIGEYLSQPFCIGNGSEYDPMVGAQARKVFYPREDIRIVVNDQNSPTHVITVSLPDCQITDRAIGSGLAAG
jgi:hypothetical protein